MLFSTPQMSSYHSLAERPIHLSVGDKPLESVHSIKLLEVHMTDTLKWDDHVKHLASSCYGVLAALSKIKNFTNYHLSKHLVECLVLSRLDFNDIIFYPITDCLLKKVTAHPVCGSQFCFWTLCEQYMKERREWHVLKAAHKAIYSHEWPKNASDTFQYSAAALFNSLPSNVKCCDNFKYLSKQTLCILRERCRDRAE